MNKLMRMAVLPGVGLLSKMELSMKGNGLATLEMAEEPKNGQMDPNMKASGAKTKQMAKES